MVTSFFHNYYEECGVQQINVFGLVLHSRLLVVSIEFKFECTRAQVSDECRIECQENRVLA